MRLDKLEPKEFEQKIYENWESKGYFKPVIDKNKTPFTIMMPPPNITGQLHMGHALDNTLQDIVIRHKRMQGFSALWLPGTDHASIATEVKIVDLLKSEGTSKEELGREEFLQRAYQWKETYGGRISKQLRRLGSSCDWSREAFTMDEKCSKAVREVFVNLYEKKLIYRGLRPINWCPSCLTALSDAEVEYEEQNSHLWHIRYPYADGSGYMIVATTRPETMLGDTAVAVNPKDKRYKDKIGKYVNLPLTDRKIPIIADDYVEVEFGTGAVKITPAHDPNDFEVGARHNLETIVVIDDKGFINKNGYKYVGLDRFTARKKMVEDLESQGLIEKIEKYTHNVGVCYRCGTVIEPLVSKQWFVKMEPLAKPAIDVVKKNKTKFIPDRFSKTYFNWMENIKDWCISRQLWWGHRIPAWYCQDCGEIIVSKTDPTKCNKCGSTNLKQDEDVLDTWFSSALWPFSTLGFPDDTEDLKCFYPTNLLVTGYDIIFFWVARMIFSGIEHMGKTPFSEVLIHGIVRDGLGRKMSKSLGNGVDPIEMIDKYGADALRLSLCIGVSPGADVRFNEEKIEPSRNFINKLWNAAKFVLLNTADCTNPAFKPKSSADKWIVHKFNILTKEVNRNFKSYDLGLVASKLYDFVWSDFCDWYIEASKSALYGEDKEAKEATQGVLLFMLKNILKLLHPFIPFVTERIWSATDEKNTIMVAEYPTHDKKLVYKDSYLDFETVKEIVRNIRNIRAEMNVDPGKKLSVFVLKSTSDKNIANIVNNQEYIKRLAGVTGVSFIANKEDINEKVVSMVIQDIEVLIPLGEMVDFEKEAARLKKEIEQLEKEIKRNESMLNNQGFLAKAPAHLVEAEKEKLIANREKMAKLERSLKEVIR
ncbi:MAG TPA: valine--tRNA ligase [Clostridia bacterium]|jgi:valyl-tRNA synthetase|nr:valine--tRNA ligase [Clostridia bacterium]